MGCKDCANRAQKSMLFCRGAANSRGRIFKFACKIIHFWRNNQKKNAKNAYLPQNSCKFLQLCIFVARNIHFNYRLIIFKNRSLHVNLLQ